MPIIRELSESFMIQMENAAPSQASSNSIKLKQWMHLNHILNCKTVACKTYKLVQRHLLKLLKIDKENILLIPIDYHIGSYSDAILTIVCGKSENCDVCIKVLDHLSCQKKHCNCNNYKEMSYHQLHVKHTVEKFPVPTQSLNRYNMQCSSFTKQKIEDLGKYHHDAIKGLQGAHDKTTQIPTTAFNQAIDNDNRHSSNYANNLKGILKNNNQEHVVSSDTIDSANEKSAVTLYTSQNSDSASCVTVSDDWSVSEFHCNTESTSASDFEIFTNFKSKSSHDFPPSKYKTNVNIKKLPKVLDSNLDDSESDDMFATIDSDSSEAISISNFNEMRFSNLSNNRYSTSGSDSTDFGVSFKEYRKIRNRRLTVFSDESHDGFYQTIGTSQYSKKRKNCHKGISVFSDEEISYSSDDDGHAFYYGAHNDFDSNSFATSSDQGSYEYYGNHAKKRFVQKDSQNSNVVDSGTDTSGIASYSVNSISNNGNSSEATSSTSNYENTSWSTEETRNTENTSQSTLSTSNKENTSLSTDSSNFDSNIAVGTPLQSASFRCKGHSSNCWYCGIEDSFCKTESATDVSLLVLEEVFDDSEVPKSRRKLSHKARNFTIPKKNSCQKFKATKKGIPKFKKSKIETSSDGVEINIPTTSKGTKQDTSIKHCILSAQDHKYSNKLHNNCNPSKPNKKKSRKKRRSTIPNSIKFRNKAKKGSQKGLPKSEKKKNRYGCEIGMPSTSKSVKAKSPVLNYGYVKSILSQQNSQRKCDAASHVKEPPTKKPLPLKKKKKMKLYDTSSWIESASYNELCH